MSATVPLVLASASPRRHELLSRLGLEFVAFPADVDETPLPGESPARHALRVAKEKTGVVAACRPDHVVLGADTIVVLAGAILGKPKDRDVARRMLRSLRGRVHTVLTALAVSVGGREASGLAHARVTFAPFSDDLLEWYLATGEPADKAGAYAVQGRGAVLVERVEGNVETVVGLPLARLPRLFADVGLELTSLGDRLVLSRRAG